MYGDIVMVITQVRNMWGELLGYAPTVIDPGYPERAIEYTESTAETTTVHQAVKMAREMAEEYIDNRPGQNRDYNVRITFEGEEIQRFSYHPRMFQS